MDPDEERRVVEDRVAAVLEAHYHFAKDREIFVEGFVCLPAGNHANLDSSERGFHEVDEFGCVAEHRRGDSPHIFRAVDDLEPAGLAVGAGGGIARGIEEFFYDALRDGPVFVAAYGAATSQE